jgi:hypothetical protein
MMFIGPSELGDVRRARSLILAPGEQGNRDAGRDGRRSDRPIEAAHARSQAPWRPRLARADVRATQGGLTSR